MISLDEALALLLDGIERSPSEQIPLAAAAWRVLDKDMIASFDQPALPVSSMDGFAVAAEDAVAGRQLRLVGSSMAGARFDRPIEPGTTIRIATGGVVPAGASRIVIKEVVRLEGGLAEIEGPIAEANFIRAVGQDFHEGQVLLSAGRRLDPAALALVAAASHGTVFVTRRPRVTIFASGDELREPGEELAPGEVANSASFAIEALVRDWGAEPDRRPTLPDDPAAIQAAIEAARSNCDIMLFIGGASVGERDYLRQVASDLGARILFDRIAIQPGKPCWHGRFDQGPLLLGVPGNPVSAFVCAHLLLEPLLGRLLGRPSLLPRAPAILERPLPEAGDRECYWRATAAIDDEARLRVTPDPARDSSLQRALAQANALIRQPRGTSAFLPGALVELLLVRAPSLIARRHITARRSARPASPKGSPAMASRPP